MYFIKVKSLQGSMLNAKDCSLRFTYRTDVFNAEQLKNIVQTLTPYSVTVCEVNKKPRHTETCKTFDSLCNLIKGRLIFDEIDNIVEEDAKESLLVALTSDLHLETFTSDLGYVFFRLKHNLFKVDIDNLKKTIEQTMKDTYGIIEQSLLLYKSKMNDWLYFKTPINELYNKKVESIEYRDKILIINYTRKIKVNKGKITKIFEY